jgi:hypothetical protein
MMVAVMRVSLGNAYGASYTSIIAVDELRASESSSSAMPVLPFGPVTCTVRLG